MEREELRNLASALSLPSYSDEQLDDLLPFVQAYLDVAPALRAMPLAEVPNALVNVSGGRK